MTSVETPEEYEIKYSENKDLFNKKINNVVTNMFKNIMDRDNRFNIESKNYKNDRRVYNNEINKIEELQFENDNKENIKFNIDKIRRLIIEKLKTIWEDSGSYRRN